MTPLWHDGPLAALEPQSDRPVAWSVALHTDPGVRASGDDLRDAATIRNGAARLARRLLARALIARVAGCDADTVAILRDGFGAPRVMTPPGWHVSLSGRSDHALIGVARAAIGVDREPFGAGGMLRDMLTPREAATLDAMPAADRPAAWLRRWTMKEAHAKLVGEPRRIPPEAIETDVADGAQGRALFEGRSRLWSRTTPDAIETVALWCPSDQVASDGR